MQTLATVPQKESHRRNSLTRGCLALNASYEPLTVLPVKRAVRLILDQKAEAVEVDETRIVRSGTGSMPYPVVIRLVRYVHVPRRFRKSVTNVIMFARDGHRCIFCGRHQSELRQRESLTRDHIIPQSRFANRNDANTYDNCATSCNSCNWKKADRTPAEANMPLLWQPTEPHFVRLVWTVRKLTPLQRKWVVQFFGEDAALALES
jgi:5-methylcytosine-specific restriction endonuclease McrA